ncbi:ester cyclase [Curtobacterium sp. MCBD17_040]|uniref:ester cyclase n=1 Tax=Curtobacterium sp. MCBD17_040 TaxID=2175674 RepID=UPI000DAA7D91|nr:ester cyclase [Curtobacterium sp. MCBD17_040]WIB63979.1 ester cyclase [Curtobacterium sp. MCBD17_040]
MSKDVNTKAQQHLGELLQQRAFDRFGEVWAEDVVDHGPAPGAAPGLAGIVAFWQEFTTAFPDVALQPETLVADDDSVSVVFTITGTHSGEFQGHAPTGRTFRVRGLQTARFEDGKIVERWGATDEKGLAEQLHLTGGETHFVTA